ncbi:MAG: group II intron reverse transcriptase domain-containing protein [Myxococcaceae bacterium]|nr:group II intron reverse transcriptase domain-containing protein [Myxococcaceae bacterium]MBH2005894.1 group II intron reverse transcriptase domain-containing protein [Myxococcaceae bacterium]
MKKGWPTWESVDRAAAACAKRKRSRPDAIVFRARYTEEVLDLCQRIRSGEYRPSSGTVFVTDRPKTREIHASHYRDRVVHHLLHDLIEPHFEQSFIKDSYACRKGKGSHAAVEALQKHMQRATCYGKIRAYALHLDIRSFFFSIHKPTLLAILESKQWFREQAELRHLTTLVINHPTALHAKPLGPPSSFERIPPLKRLGALGEDRGLPIGNLTSQLFANIYLDVLDQMIKRTLGAQYYVRYSDDLVLLHRDADQLASWKQQIIEFLQQRLKLETHEKAPIHPVSEGVDFVGYVIRPAYKLCRARVIRHAHQRITELEKPLHPEEREGYQFWRVRHKDIEALRACWASYAGHLKHASAYRVAQKLLKRHPISQFYLRFEIAKHGISVARRFALPKIESCWNHQIHSLHQSVSKPALRSAEGSAVLLVQVGRYAECPLQKDAERLELRRGLPWRRLPEIIDRAVQKGLKVAVAVEFKKCTGRIRARYLAYWVEPVARPVLLSEGSPKAVQLEFGFS